MSTIQNFVLTARWYEIILAGWCFFGGIYFLFGAVTTVLTRWLMPALGRGGRLDPRPVAAGQLKREIGLSVCSALLFGAGMVFPWGLLQLGWARLAVEPSWWRVVLEILVLVVWNEVHFYANHWLLHTRWLRRFHNPHHRSVVTTPWATYSFHPVEAVMLGNVILLPMVVHDFSFAALFSVPLFSLLFNCIGHSNYDFLPDFHRDRWWLNGARRHHLHHACFTGNYGFMFPFMDRLCGTALPPEAAESRIARDLNRRLADAG
ncbi:sterol desaturase family protein [Azoarcus sp. TTM-91]|uniref:sterol desaturase family protein n=1 Tax=Azoarcus sp. TTM-91 TaxID=2691581 RepID=UPI001B7D2690|nr:sterol desaturase family protein [Azoarcus sp. TTM-91]